MNNQKLKFLTALILGVSFFGCPGPTNKTSNSTTSSSQQPITPVGPCRYGNGSETGVASGGQNIEYYKINNPPVIAHGSSDGQIVWSSANNLPSGISQLAFQTDAKFSLRIIPRSGPAQGTSTQRTSDKQNRRYCNFSPQPYQKLQVGVVVRRAEDAPGTGSYHLFNDVQVNCASQVYDFPVPANTANLVVEIKNVKWDWSCKDYANQGYSNVQGVCPWDNVWRNDCYQIEIQFATDGTKDLPRL